MAHRKIKLTESEITKRNISLHGAFMQYILDQPDLLDKLPSDFRLVILPDNDPELRAYNLEILDQRPSKNKPIVFVRVKLDKQIDFSKHRPMLYLPLAV